MMRLNHTCQQTLAIKFDPLVVGIKARVTPLTSSKNVHMRGVGKMMDHRACQKSNEPPNVGSNVMHECTHNNPDTPISIRYMTLVGRYEEPSRTAWAR
jgi:hypothetical protein